MATRAPSRPAPAVSSCARAASQRLNPDRSRIAKSPTSCGISWTVCREISEELSYVSIVSISTYAIWQKWLECRVWRTPKRIQPRLDRVWNCQLSWPRGSDNQPPSSAVPSFPLTSVPARVGNRLYLHLRCRRRRHNSQRFRPLVVGRHVDATGSWLSPRTWAEGSPRPRWHIRKRFSPRSWRSVCRKVPKGPSAGMGD